MRILAVTGASGGHIFPALSFLDSLSNKRKDIDALLVLPKKSIMSQINNINYKIGYISISSIKFGFRSFSAILNFFKGSYESIGALLKFRPDVVVGFGSLASIPMVLFARFLGINTLIHEQNVIPGWANRFLARFADKIGVSFLETGDYLKNYKKKIVLTGNPLRKELNQIEKNKALDFFGLNSRKFTILVMGGSQASHRINLGLSKAVAGIRNKSGFQVIHLAGSQDYDLLNKSYRDSDIDFRLFSFLEPMQYAYSACDLVVSRAGALTIAEIIFFGLPAIIIPYPFAHKHQTANAEVLKAIGSGIVIQDKELGSDVLSRKIEELMDNPERIKALRSCYERLPKMNASDSLAEAVLSLN